MYVYPTIPNKHKQDAPLASQRLNNQTYHGSDSCSGCNSHYILVFQLRMFEISYWIANFYQTAVNQSIKNRSEWTVRVDFD